MKMYVKQVHGLFCMFHYIYFEVDTDVDMRRKYSYCATLSTFMSTIGVIVAITLDL